MKIIYTVPCSRRTAVFTARVAIVRRIATIVLCVHAAATHAIPGQAGTLDATWASGSAIGAGKVLTAVGGVRDSATAVVVQPDGMIIVAGHCLNVSDIGFCAARYRSNGTLDTSWGVSGTGKVITLIGGAESLAFAIALQPDGKVLLAGQCYDGTRNQFCSLRLIFPRLNGHFYDVDKGVRDEQREEKV
jgi:uncharacterized delta-60 repeat protein